MEIRPAEGRKDRRTPGRSAARALPDRAFVTSGRDGDPYGRSDQCTRIAWQSETGDGKAGGEGEIGHLVKPTNAASARFRHNEVAVEAHAALAA